MPEDISTRELSRKIDNIRAKLDEVIDQQVDQGTRLAVMNQHLETLNGSVKDNCDDIDNLKKHQRKIIGMGILIAVILPLLFTLVMKII